MIYNIKKGFTKVSTSDSEKQGCKRIKSWFKIKSKIESNQILISVVNQSKIQKWFESKNVELISNQNKSKFQIKSWWTTQKRSKSNRNNVRIKIKSNQINYFQW